MESPAPAAVSGRAKVTKGLPDAVAIRERKVSEVTATPRPAPRPLTLLPSIPQSLCLTCFIDGDPAPEVFWLRNDREIFHQGQFSITREPQCSSITINDVTVENSGKYSIFVRNQHGSETVDVTVSVYKSGEKPPENAVEMG